jgi:hypothetical protein
VSHRLDAAGIDRLHLFDQLENAVEVALGGLRASASLISIRARWAMR